MAAHIFQQASADPSAQTPWPVVIDGTKVIHGRPDAQTIIGFVAVDAPHKILVFAKDLADQADDELAKQIEGLTPVFVGHDGGMFGVPLPVRDIRSYTGDLVALAASNTNLIENHAATLGN